MKSSDDTRLPKQRGATRPELSRSELRTLARMVYIASVVLNSGREPENRLRKYDELESKVLEWVRSAGLPELVEICEEDHRHPSKLLEEDLEIQAYMEEYDAEVFWDELAHRLADREFFRDIPQEQLERMSAEEKMEAKEPYLSRYRSEIEEHGFERLKYEEF